MGRKGADPLRHKNLDLRFEIFQIACLPAILNQENQNFKWILLIDPALPFKYKTKLENLVLVRPDTHLVRYSSELNINNLDWLSPLIHPETRYVITTKLDDDDAIFTGFTNYIANHINKLYSSGMLLPVNFYACKNNCAWDLYYSKNEKLGFVKPYPIKNQPPSAGFSLSCKYPELNLSVLSFSHHNFEYLSEQTKEIPENTGVKVKTIERNRKLIKDLAQATKLAWNGELNDHNFHYLDSDFMQSLITNHFDNIQLFRIFRNSETRTPVDEKSTFPEFSINFKQAESYIAKSKPSIKVIIKLYFRILNFIPSRFKDKPLVFRMKLILIEVWQLTKHIRKLK